MVDRSAQSAWLTALPACLLFVALTFAERRVLIFLHGEDGLIEIASALAYPVGAFFAFHLARDTQGWPRAHWMLWTVLCVLFFGEETSWLQHWTGYATPESVKAVNVQSEFNLHNLNIFEPKRDLVTGAGVAFAWQAWLSSQHLFYAGFATYFLLIPLARWIPAIDRIAVRLGVPRISGRFMLAVWIPIVLSAALTVACADDALRKEMIGETREMVFAVGIAAMIVIAWRRAKNAASRAGQSRPRKRLSSLQRFSKIR